MTHLPRFAASLCALTVAACAESGALETIENDIQGGDSFADAGTSTDAASSNDSGVDRREDAGTPGDSSAPEPPEAGQDAAPESCEPTSTCAAPVMLGQISGDQGADVLTTTGAGPAFVAVHVSEDDHGLFGVELKLEAKLDSPSGTNFDLYLYGEQDACATLSNSAMSEFDDIVTFSWPDGRAAESGRTIVFEVRHVSGPCRAASPWRLDIHGN